MQQQVNFSTEILGENAEKKVCQQNLATVFARFLQLSIKLSGSYFLEVAFLLKKNFYTPAADCSATWSATCSEADTKFFIILLISNLARSLSLSSAAGTVWFAGCVYG